MSLESVDLDKPTDELFISRLLTYNPETRYIFRGVFSLDEIVIKPSELPAAYIYNTFPRYTKSVGHWICLYVTKTFSIEFFGSYGLPPPIKLLRMVRHWTRKVTWNKIRYQHYTSNVYGLYAVYYLHYRCHRWTMKQIQEHFNRNALANDIFIK